MSQKKYYRAVIISPHLDDAVFSCGGLISQMRSEGPVLVINVFTRYLAESRQHAVVMTNQRHEEELAASNFLGFESKKLDELDAIFRRPAYKKIGNVFRPPVPEDMLWLSELRAKLYSELEKVEFKEVYVPFGVGWHVDHILTNLVFENWSGSQGLFYYEEAPYCLIANCSRYRLSEVQGKPDINWWFELRAWWQTTCAYTKMALMQNLKPWWIKAIAPIAVGIYFYRLMSLYRSRWKTVSEVKALSPIHIPISENLEDKIKAMMLYQSQFCEFFLSEQDCRKLMRDHSNEIAPHHGPIERYWSSYPKKEMVTE
jgi:LmbE family N-acetylglucosaminyl deacetylase